MSATFHLVTGEYPPQAGGVGDYTAVVAAALAQRGADVHVWTPHAEATNDANGLRVHALADRFGRSARRQLEQGLASAPGCMLLQYVPNALGARGANLPFCLWLLRMRQRGTDVRVMFHEPYFYFSARRPLRSGLALAQRLMAALLLRAARIAYLSTDTWTVYLRPYAPGGTIWTTLPVPSTIPSSIDGVSTARWRARGLAAGGRWLIGHFGTFGADLVGPLDRIVPAVLAGRADVHFLCVGRNSDVFAGSIASRYPDLRNRIHAAGALAPSELAAALTACDLLIQPYPDGVTTRRTSVMAGLANGVPTVTTSGALTEDVWAATGAVALVPVLDMPALAEKAASLLADDGARTTLAARGRRVYEERFAVEHTVRHLLENEGSGGRGQGSGGGSRQGSDASYERRGGGS